jgi:WD40 repeat protein
LENVLETFGRYRLLTFDRDPATRNPTVEIAHEALIREWSRLRQWLDESRDDIRQERDVSRTAEDWDKHHREESYLLRGARLEQVDNWMATSSLVQTPLVQEFVSVSLQKRDQERQEEAQRQAREQQLERRSQVFLRGLVVVFALATIISIGLVILTISQRQSAIESAAEAQNVALVAGSQAALADNDTDTALALAWEAVNLYPDSALAQAQLSAAAYAPGTVRIFEGSEISANRVMFSPDGRFVFAGVDDGSVFFWEAATGRLLWQHQADTREINDAAFSPDGRLVAVTFDDRILFWHTLDGQLFQEIDSSALDQKIAFHPAGEEFATIGKEDESILVFWDLDSGEQLRQYERGTNIEEFLFTHDGSNILMASQTGELTLLDTETAEIIYTVAQDTVPGAGVLRIISLSPDGDQIAGSFSNSGLLVWNVADGEVIQDVRIPGGSLSVAYHPHNGTILSGGLQTINPDTGEILWVNNTVGSAILDISISPDGRYAVSSALDGSIRLWELEHGQVELRYSEPSGVLFEVAVSPDGKMVLGGTTDGKVTLWDLETGEVIHQFIDDQPIMAVAFSPDGQQALIGAGYRLAQEIESGHIILWDVETGEEIRRLEGQPYVVFDVEFSPDGQQAVSVGNGAMAILWDVETGTEIRRFEDYWVDSVWPNESFWSASFTPDGQQIYASHSGGFITNWDKENGAEIRTLVGHEEGSAAIVFNQEGDQFVTGGVDSQVILWDNATGEILRRFTGYSSSVGEIRFSPDETLLLGGGDGTSSLWRIDTGEAIRRYGGGFAFSPNFSPDGKHAVIGFRDGKVELWRIDATLDELLTWTENNRYLPEVTCEQRLFYNLEPLCEPES